MSRINAIAEFVNYSAKSKIVSKLNRPIGVELEMTKLGNFEVTPPDSVVRDGSVSGEQRELIIRAKGGDEFVSHLISTVASLNINGATVDHTCGTHVHVNGLDASWWNIAGVMLGYCKAQKDFYQLCAPGRQGNQFCRPSTWTTTFPSKVMSIKSNEQVKDLLFDTLYGYERPKVFIAKSSFTFNPESWDRYYYHATKSCPVVPELINNYGRAECPPVAPGIAVASLNANIWRSMSRYSPISNSKTVLEAVNKGWLIPSENIDVGIQARYNPEAWDPKWLHKRLYDLSIQTLNSIRGTKYAPDTRHHTRYNGLNLHSWFYRGSIEFRMKEGSVDIMEVLPWALLCGWFVETTMNIPLQRLDKCQGLVDILALNHSVPTAVIEWVKEKLNNVRNRRD